MDIWVCGAQVPFARGGAELAMENLVEALNKAQHRAELVRLPVAWEKDRIFDAALAWRLIPADVDLVIAINFPSYFIRHPRKIVWLFHQHRAAYDSSDLPWSDISLDDVSLETQRLLTEWDNHALEEAEKLFTISKTVGERLARYNGLEGEPLYHPPPLHGDLKPGTFSDYAFCPLRLERNKRPELIIQALEHVTSDARVVLAGTGSMEKELASTAGRLGVASRLTLTGFVPDLELIDFYANAFSVIYVPYEEDYGYVTLQAFAAGKPVITSKDSGGVLEWVRDGETGIVTDGSPADIAKAVDKLRKDEALARRLGEAGRKLVAGLSWDHVVKQLLR